jgi:rubrerythrin
MSMIENLKLIQEKGMAEFLRSQEEKYRCPSCGDVVSVHDGKCYGCGYQGQKPQEKVGRQQWDKARWAPNRK